MIGQLAAVLTVSACSLTSVLGVHLNSRDVDAPLLDSYDYIVVGCGISGLVVTNRLSEDPNITVLCIEAGIADHYEPLIQYPVYVGGDIGGIYDWDLSTVPQTQLDGATRPLPQGKVLGGGSILNAMCWNRGGADDYDAWEALGNPGWGWEGMLPYFIKSETYTPVYSEDVAQEYSINYNPAVHGTSGPVQVSYPKYFYPQSVNLFEGLNALGIPTQFDPNDGTSAGPALVPTDLDPNNQTRSDARRAYFDPVVDRENFHVITGQHVTRILIEGVGANTEVTNPAAGGNENGEGTANGNPDGFGFGPSANTPPDTPPAGGQTSNRFIRRQDPSHASLRVTGVEFAPNASAARRTVYATREVIVAAGSLHSAQLLQLSGIGPLSLLTEYNIPVALDLPGVGNNLQDHCLVGTFYPYNNNSYPSPAALTTNTTFNAAAQVEYTTNKTGPWTAGSPNALAFNPLPLITEASGLILLNASLQDPTTYLISGLDPTLVAGYTLQKRSLVERLAQTNVAAYEIINNNAGSLTVAVMHPFSRGAVYVNSADPFEPPQIDPRWLSNPVDRQILVEAIRFNREILATPSMRLLQAAQFVPPTDANEDAINQVINSGIRTEFHPSGTCAMLPLEQGGVVDPHLRVWGTQNLRVVDAGIFPMVPGAHLQAVVYGVAEKAADIIKADNVHVHPSAVPSPSAAATSASAIGSGTSSATSVSTNQSAASVSLVSSTSAGQIGHHSGSLVAPTYPLTAATTTSSTNTQSPELSSTSSSLQEYPISFHAVASVSESLSSGYAAEGSMMSARSSTSVSTSGLTSTSVAPTAISTLHAALSTLDVPSIIDSESQAIATTTPLPTPSLLSPPELTSSVSAALTAGGVPASIVSSLVPVIVGSHPASASIPPSATASVLLNEQAEQAAIEAFIQWLLSFFR